MFAVAPRSQFLSEGHQPEFPLWTSDSRIVRLSCHGYNEFASRAWEVLFRIGCDAISAPAVSRDDVFRTLNENAWTKNRSKEVEFCHAKALAGGCCSTDGAVVLNEEEGTFPGRLDVGHVAFLGSDASQFVNLLL
jgi:hypothetical protein